MLSRRYQLLLLAVLVLAAYYPATQSGFSRIDDSTMAEQFQSIENWNWQSIVIPRISGGMYYRPMLVSSFLFDKYWLGLMPGLMHLENVLLHLCNAILVYFLTFYLLPSETRSRSYLPLLAGILFGLHPVNTESVNWISGRTDILSGCCILMSALLLVRYRELDKKRYLVLSAFAFLGGALTKETALAYLPGAVLLLNTVPRAGIGDVRAQQPSGQDRFRHNAMLAAGVLLAVAAFFLLRSMAFTSNASRITITLRSIAADWNHAFFVALRAFGFYLKKLAIPYPLNFAIVEVDPLYELLAVPFVALCVYAVLRRTVASAVFLTGIFLIMPSFLIAFGQVAWTPYAERYVYIPSAFIIVSAALFGRSHLPEQWGRAARMAMIVLAAVFFSTTFARCLTWQDDLKLCRDTVTKSPLAKEAKLPYAGLLADKGDYAEALKQLELGRMLPSLEYDERFELGIARTYYLQGRVDEAVSMSEEVLKKSKGTSVLALKYLVAILEERKGKGRNREENSLLLKRLFAYNTSLYEKNQDLHVLYHAGSAAAGLGDDRKAMAAFQKVYDGLPANDFYKWYAKTGMRNLAQRKTYKHADQP